MRRIALFATSLSLVACGSLPPFPETQQCGYDGEDGVFRCVNTKTHARKAYPQAHHEMHGAQCLPINDKYRSYQSAEAWIKSVKDIAETRCR